MDGVDTASRRWVMVYEGEGTSLSFTCIRSMPVGTRLRLGREGDLLVGVQPLNQGISRTALHVTATQAGWRIEVRNRSGAFLHPWAQPALAATTDDTLNWPLVGVRLLHESPTAQHWILLATEEPAVTPAGPTGSISVGTAAPDRPRPLSPGQRQALEVVFGAVLSWPPRHPATPLLLKQAASRIGISQNALQDRLTAAWEKAVQLGLNDAERKLTDPGYLFALVRGGYIPVPAAVVPPAIHARHDDGSRVVAGRPA